MKLNEIMLCEETVVMEKVKVTLSNKEKVTLTLNALSSGGKNNWRNQGYDLIIRNSKNFPRSDTDVPKGPTVHMGYTIHDQEEVLQKIADRISKVEVDLPDRKMFDEEFAKIVSEEMKKDRTIVSAAQTDFNKWTDKDWDELWNNPTPQKVFEWEHGGKNYNNKSYIKLKDISVKDGRVSYGNEQTGGAFVWNANRDRLPFKLDSVSRFTVWGNNKLKSTEGFPLTCENFSVKDGEFTTVTKIPKGGTSQQVSFENCKVSTLDITDQGHDKLYLKLKGCPLTSLDGMPRRVSTLDIDNTKIDDLHNIHKKFDHLWGIDCNFVTKNVLGVLLIPGFGRINPKDYKVTSIVGKYCNKGKAGVIEAQNELVEAGLEEYAEL